MPSFGLLDVPRMSARETEYGMKSIATYPGGQVYEAHCFMPNILFRQVPIPQDPSKMSIHLAWRVPIDDENMISYMVTLVPPFDDEIRMMLESSADFDDLTRHLLTCELPLEAFERCQGPLS